jgi:hypothetical protein
MQKKSVLFIVLMAVAFAPALMAHNWGCYELPSATVGVQSGGGSSTAVNEWNDKTAINVVGGNTVRVFSANSGNTGWGGLATISISGCTIMSCDAQLNTYYSWTANEKRGVYCQEVGHCWGLDHSNDGGCMGGGYYYPIGTFPGYTVVQHNIDDMESKYGGGSCKVEGESCSNNGQCCSGNCSGKGSSKTCSGTAQAEMTFLGGSSPFGEHHGEDLEDLGDHLVVAPYWLHHPTTLSEAIDLSSAIVSARVTAIYEGADIVNEGAFIPTQRIAFEVNGVLDGEVADSFELFHTGNSEYVLDGDPPYEVGTDYVLFLMPREDGSYLVISPEGRYQMTGDGLRAESEESFARVVAKGGLRALAVDLAARRTATERQ